LSLRPNPHCVILGESGLSELMELMELMERECKAIGLNAAVAAPRRRCGQAKRERPDRRRCAPRLHFNNE
jgi:hypothetical protein